MDLDNLSDEFWVTPIEQLLNDDDEKGITEEEKKENHQLTMESRLKYYMELVVARKILLDMIQALREKKVCENTCIAFQLCLNLIEEKMRSIQILN